MHGEGDTGARPTARLDWDKKKPDPSNRAPDWLQAGGNKLEKKKSPYTATPTGSRAAAGAFQSGTVKFSYEKGGLRR